jgi:hypothetical protein
MPSPLLLVACWVCALLGPASLLLIPALIAGTIALASRRRWIGLSALLALNPLTVLFVGGIVSYVGGAPCLRFVGYPGADAFNLDPSTRCFRTGGGCLLLGNEWVYLIPHNLALRLMSRTFGPPSRSYDGPYPSKDEALALVSNAPTASVSGLMADRVEAGRKVYLLEEGVGYALVIGLRFFPEYEADTPEEERIKVSAAIHQERCLVLRIRQKDTGHDYVVLCDTANGKPFAYFQLLRKHPTCAPVRYYDPKYVHALQSAAEKGEAGTLERLAGQGVALDLQTRTGRTALMTAVEHSHVEAVSALLAHGADVNLKDGNEQTALYLLGPHDREICALLLEHGADVNVRDRHGKTPLE